jgi:predicted nuclease of predicted toxin-antitoxin system
MIRLLADENIPPAVVEFFRERGFDVKDVNEGGFAGASDDEIMLLACREERVLLTFDKHFANILTYPPGSHYGIIRIRIHPPLIEDIIHAFDQLMKGFDLNTINGSLIVLEREGFRLRGMP